MKRKIFKKSDKSKIKYSLGFRSCSWWLRSTRRFYDYCVTGVNFYGFVRIYYTNGKVYSMYDYHFVAPVCTI